MSKYSFDRLEPKQFEAMCQALLEKRYRAHGNLIQFREGPDGGRETTWTQPLDHPDYVKPSNVTEKVPKEWVFQVKYHDGSQLGWNKARKAVVRDLNSELEKIVHKYKVPCHAYVMITNVPFTGVITVGTRDKITTVTEQWKQYIPEIYVWDAADLSCMLDADQDVRNSRLGCILPGDILNAIYQDITYTNERRKSALKAYLNYVLKCESSAKAQDAGDEQNLPLSEVFIDFTLSLLDFQIYRESSQKINQNQNDSAIDLFPEYKSALSPSDWSKVRASNALFFLDSEFILLLGGPGLGKSTLTQFLSLYQAVRILKQSDLALSLAKRLKLPQEIKTEQLDSYVSLFFPFRVELRRYAKWMSEQFNNDGETHLALYIVKKLINENASSSLEMDDIFGLASTDPILLILDGLDEVPNPETRQKIIENLRVFVNRVKAEQGKLQVILSSRPNGYSGEFSEFEPVTWKLNDLERADFDEYCDQWLQQRIPSAEERGEAKEKIEAGMQSEAVQRLAESLLQATVILTIVRRKVQIPHEKHLLYKTYVDVIFAREKDKTPLVNKWANELLQLHERVGFELHCKMENSQIEALNNNDFRGYICDILGDCPGEIFEGSTLNRTTDEIIEMATDRLCLLAGTGENQGQIDFLLQQYREYFAASYLTKHPDAEPESVFSTLIKRGAYWFYVLQFYVAQAQPYQQISWLREIQYREEIIDRTIASRAILNVLPEFNFSRQKDLEFALRVIFDKTIRWTWLEQKSVIDILKVTRSGSALPYIWKWLNDLSLKDQGNLESELSLLAQTYHLKPKFSLENEFENKIQELLQEEHTKQIAILTSLNNDLGIDVASCNLLDFELVFNKFNYLTRILGEENKKIDHFTSCQTTEKLYELLFCFLPLGVTQKQSYSANQSKFHLSLFGNSVTLILKNYLPGEFFILYDSLSSYLSSDTIEKDNIYFKYFLSLIEATNDLDNSDLEQTVRDLERTISNNHPLIYLWKSYNWLGPDVTAFNSIDDWCHFRQTLMELCEEDQEWFTNSIDFDSSPHLWTSLFFHPNHWPLLREEELITEEDYQQLLDSSLAHLLKIPTKPIDLFEGWIVSSHDTIPLIKILKAALKVLEDYGVEHLGNAKGLDGILGMTTIESVTKQETESILSKVINLPKLPPIWAGAFLLMCLYTPSINIDLLIYFLEKNQDIRIIPVNEFDKKNSPNKTKLVNELLMRENQSALPLVATIICCGVSIDKDTQSKLHDRLVKEFDNYLDNDNIIEILLKTLLRLPFNIEECLIWERPEIIEKIEKLDYYFLNRLCERFLETGNIINQLDYEKLREHFMVFIDNRNSYPSELVLSALEVIIKIDIDKAKRSELKDEDWQRPDY